MPLAAIPWLGTAIAGAAGAGATVYAARSGNKAGERATRASIDANNRAAEIEAQAAREALAFQREIESRRQQEWQQMQDRNYGIYQDERAADDSRFQFDQDIYANRLARSEPFRAVGVGTLGQLLSPQAYAGTIGETLRRPIPPMPRRSLTTGGGGGGYTGDTSAERGEFDAMFPGDTLTSAQLLAQRDALRAKGWDTLTNASGITGKVRLPNGVIVDVIEKAGAGGNRKQWLV